MKEKKQNKTRQNKTELVARYKKRDLGLLGSARNKTWLDSVKDHFLKH